MRQLAIVEFVTLDGVIQGFDGPDPDDPDFPHAGWGRPYLDAISTQAGVSGQAEAAAYLFGRKTYERMNAFWPHQPDDNPMAAHLNRAPKFVASRTLSTVEWNNAQLLRGDAAEAVRGLKQSGTGTIVVLGSGELVQALFAHDLVDGYTLFLHPLILRSGRSLFRTPGDPTPLRLLGVEQTSTGVLILRYTRHTRHTGP